MNIAIVGFEFARDFVEAIAPRIRALGHEVLVQVGESDGLHAEEAWTKTEVLIPVGIQCGRALMSTVPSLRAVICPTIGIDAIDIAAATELGILVVNGRVAENAISMAEATVLLILASCYDLTGASERMRDPGYNRRAPSMLRGKAIGIVGYGSIAQEVIRRLAVWDMTISVYTRHIPRDAPPDIAFVALDALLRSSDIVAVLTRLTVDTYHLLDREKLSWMRTGAILVNTSRGALVDERALADCLRDRHLAFAALDVFETEPLPENSPLRSLDNVLLTPHCVGHTRESREAMPEALLSNLETVAAGHIPESTCNPEVAQRWLTRWMAGDESVPKS